MRSLPSRQTQGAAAEAAEPAERAVPRHALDAEGDSRRVGDGPRLDDDAHAGGTGNGSDGILERRLDEVETDRLRHSPRDGGRGRLLELGERAVLAQHRLGQVGRRDEQRAVVPRVDEAAEPHDPLERVTQGHLGDPQRDRLVRGRDARVEHYGNVRQAADEGEHVGEGACVDEVEGDGFCAAAREPACPPPA